jgi:WD40 repeat protein
VRGDGKVTLWNVRSARAVATLHGHTGWIWSVVFSPDGRTLATGGTDRTVRVWDVVEALDSGRG